MDMDITHAVSIPADVAAHVSMSVSMSVFLSVSMFMFVFMFMCEFCRAYFNSIVWQRITFNAYLSPEKPTNNF